MNPVDIPIPASASSTLAARPDREVMSAGQNAANTVVCGPIRTGLPGRNTSATTGSGATCIVVGASSRFGSGLRWRQVPRHRPRVEHSPPAAARYCRVYPAGLHQWSWGHGPTHV